jgi:hypothetical protein
MIRDLIKDCFIHLTELHLKTDNMISFESRLFDINEFGKIILTQTIPIKNEKKSIFSRNLEPETVEPKIITDFDFVKDKSSMYNDFENLYKDNSIIKTNQKGVELLKVNFVFNSTLSYSKNKKNELISKFFDKEDGKNFMYLLDEAFKMLNDLLIEKGYDIKFSNPLVGLKPEDCIHLKDKKNIEFLVKYSTFVLGSKTINRL